MELTLLILWTIAILSGKCYSDGIIKECPDGQKYVTEYSDVSLTCGPCQELMKWYVGDNSGEDKKSVGECTNIACNVDNSAAFHLKVNRKNTPIFESVLDILNFTRNNTSFVCKCYRYGFRIFPPLFGYYLQSGDSCNLFITVPPGNPQLQCPQTVLEGSNVSCTCTSDNKGSPPAQYVWDGADTDTLLLQDVRKELNAMKYTCRQIWGHHGLIDRTIVYTLQVVENKEPPSKNMKEEIVNGVFAVVVAIAIIGIMVTVYILKLRKGMFCKGKINLRSLPCPSNLCHRKKPLSPSYAVVNRSETPVIHYKAPSGDIYTIASTTTADTGYMNVTEVPTGSGLGVYHIVPRAVMSAHPQPDREENYEAVLLEEEYNVLKFEANRTEQEDQRATYHHLKHN